MEFIAFCVVCYLVWKAIDGLSSKDSAEIQASRTTTITDGPEGRSVVTKIHEQYTGYQENRSLGKPARPATPSIPSRNETRIIDVTQDKRSITEERPRDWYSSQSRRQEVIASRPLVAPPPPPRPTTKHEHSVVCSSCGKSKPPSDFFNSRSGGTTAWCKQCHSDNQKVKPGENRHYKICPKCKSRRLRTNFGKSEKNPDGLTKWCLPCLKKIR